MDHDHALSLGLLPDWAIRNLAERRGMISPFTPALVRPAGASYGLGSAGYDIRLSREFMVAADNGVVMDPRAPREDAFVCTATDRLVLPPHGFALGCSMEAFRMPRDVLGLAIGKSTLARLGVHILVTPLEPGWSGTLTIELANLTAHPAAVYAGDGITQVLFIRILAPNASYADRDGIYQHQTGVTPARTGRPNRPVVYLSDPDD